MTSTTGIMGVAPIAVRRTAVRPRRLSTETIGALASGVVGTSAAGRSDVRVWSGAVRAPERKLTGWPRRVLNLSAEERAEERRRLQRKPTEIKTALKDANGTIIQAIISDLSESGLRVSVTAGPPLRVGRIYSVRLPGLEVMAACTTWAKSGHGGMAFVEPLHAAVLDELFARL
ncbi:MAG: PilZ domain-containing protein [Erythrobacter sp.]